MTFIANGQFPDYMDLENRIRRKMGQAIFRVGKTLFERTLEPISLDGESLIYDGRLNLQKYREYFPGSDDYATVYLTLKENMPEFAEQIAEIYELQSEMTAAATKDDFDSAIEFRDKKIKTCKVLAAVINRYWRNLTAQIKKRKKKK